jgi:hypothetical protein
MRHAVVSYIIQVYVRPREPAHSALAASVCVVVPTVITRTPSCLPLLMVTTTLPKIRQTHFDIRVNTVHYINT